MQKLALILVAIMVIYFGGSWAEVACKNVNHNPQYWKYNFFVLFVEAHK